MPPTTFSTISSFVPIPRRQDSRKHPIDRKVGVCGNFVAYDPGDTLIRHGLHACFSHVARYPTRCRWDRLSKAYLHPLQPSGIARTSQSLRILCGLGSQSA